MTRGRKIKGPDAIQKAIADLEAMKARRGAGAEPQHTEQPAPKKRGRPPKAKAELVPATLPTETPQPAPAPARRGRKAASPAPTQRPSFGVSQLTAHRPLGLLEVQEKTDLDALLADPRLAPHIAMRLGDHFALVLPASLERLQTALLKAGHTPKLQART